MGLIRRNPWALDISHETELTIAGGIITPALAYHRVDTQADAPSDDLDTIGGGFPNAVLLLRVENPDREVVLKHNTGNLILPNAADMTLNGSKLYQGLWYNGDTSKWQGLESAYYSLRDLFTTPRVAGAVNGTAAEPGPGTRTVTDTESKISIT